MKKFYPELHIASVVQGILITKNPLDKKLITFLKDRNNKIGEAMGKILGYPCYKSWEKKGYHKVIDLNLKINFPMEYNIEIFGNTFCSDKNLKDFEKLAKKYEKVLKNKDNVFRRIIDRVEVEYESRNLDEYIHPGLF